MFEYTLTCCNPDCASSNVLLGLPVLLSAAEAQAEIEGWCQDVLGNWHCPACEVEVRLGLNRRST